MRDNQGPKQNIPCPMVVILSFKYKDTGALYNYKDYLSYISWKFLGVGRFPI